MKLKIFCKTKDTVKRTKKQPTEWKKISSTPHLTELISVIYKELKKIDTDLNRDCSTEESQVTEKHLKKCSTSLAIREMQIKIALKFHLTPVRMAKITSTSAIPC